MCLRVAAAVVWLEEEVVVIEGAGEPEDRSRMGGREPVRDGVWCLERREGTEDMAVEVAPSTAGRPAVEAEGEVLRGSSRSRLLSEEATESSRRRLPSLLSR
jgi:hypothetical protein